MDKWAFNNSLHARNCNVSSGFSGNAPQRWLPPVKKVKIKRNLHQLLASFYQCVCVCVAITVAQNHVEGDDRQEQDTLPAV